MPDENDPEPSASSKHQGLPLISPDQGEVEHADDYDDPIPSRGYSSLPVIGLGGSAGSIPALREFFEKIPPASGFAYVVVIHLAPGHHSTLPALLQRSTAMEVRAAEDGQALALDTVSVIPPDKFLTVSDGHLRLTDLQPSRGRRIAVDLLFRSLADTHGPHATAIVLSGADGDGAIGLKRIKERGGLTIAQDPQEAEHRGMPSSAIATGMVDWVLKAGEMPSRIEAYYANAARLQLPPEQGPQPALANAPAGSQPESLLREVLALLRLRTGRDFTYYKRATIVRRIARRMQVNGLQDMAQYLAHLRTNPGEAGALLQDLLISVTNFFRDREAFEAVAGLIPELFRAKKPGESVRVWCAACATGEEVYSMAIMLLEQARKMESPPTLQVFGCDLDDVAIQTARVGFYPDAITADVSEERLQNYFVKEPGGYRVRREVREMVLFATHDLLKDAPFSRMDLCSCRNLLIYLNDEAQRRALAIFNFALRPGGLLFLGASEVVQAGTALFEPVDKKNRIYRQLPVQRLGLPLPTGVSGASFQRLLTQHPRVGRPPVTLGPSFLSGALPPVPDVPSTESISAAELHFKLLGYFGPSSLVVNAAYDILHLSENANRFLQFPEGEPTRSLPLLVHPLLRHDVRSALLRARETGAPVDIFRRLVELQGSPKAVDVRITPAGALAPEYFLVVFAEHEPTETGASVPPVIAAPEPVAVVHQLERELARAQASLRANVEQSAASTEELKASNEELQAMNEELRSSGEELETGREELQSVNEELTAVNAEFKNRAEELARANSDLHNLMSATQIATVFLGRDLQIMRYTPAAVPLFHLIPGDVGRPLAHLKHRLDYPDLAADAAHVLQTLAPVDRELRDGDRWLLARVLPYRTVDDYIAGVVLTFVDITGRKHAEEARRAAEERYRALFLSMDEAYAVVEVLADANGVWNDFLFLEVNPAFLKQTGMKPPVGRKATELLGTPNPHWAQVYGRVVETGEPLRFEESEPSLGRVFDLYCFRLENDGSRRVAVLFTDVTERKERERHQEFLLKLSDALRAETTADDVTNRALRMLLEQMSLDQCYVVTYRPEEDRADLTHQVGNDRVPPLPAAIRLSDFPAALRVAVDRTLVIEDCAEAEGLSDADQRNISALGLRALVAPSLRKGENHPLWTIVAVSASPRRWTRGEIALLEEVTERTWATVERASAEEALRYSEERYRMLFEASPIPFVVTEPDAPHFTVIGVNEAYLTATMQTRETLVGRHLFEAFPDDPAHGISSVLRASFERVVATRQRDVMPVLKYDIARPDGTFEERWWIPVQSPVLDDHGQVEAVIHNATDVTAEHLAEEAMRASESDARTLSALQSALVAADDPKALYGQVIDAAVTLMRSQFASLQQYRPARAGSATGRDELELLAHRGFDAQTAEFWQRVRADSLSTCGIALKEGRRVIEPDVANSQQMAGGTDRETYLAAGIRAVQTTPLYSRAGRLLGMISTHWDHPHQISEAELRNFDILARQAAEVIESLQAQEALRRSEERYRMLFEASPLPFIVTKPDAPHFTVIGVNDAYLTATMRTREALVGRHLFEAFPDDQTRGVSSVLRASFERVLATRQQDVMPIMKYDIARSDGTFDERWWIPLQSPVLDDNGEVEAIIHNATDVTEIHRAGAALRASEQWLRTMADAVPQIIWMNNGRGVADYFNRRWHEYSGLSYDRSVGLGWEAIIHPDDAHAAKEKWTLAQATGEVFESECRLRDQDGIYRWFIARNVPVRDETGRVVSWFGTATDINDLKNGEAQLKEADRRKNHFLATLGHELRNPLAAIHAGLQLLASPKAKPESKKRALPAVLGQAAHMERLVDDLLEVTRIMDGRINLHTEELTLQDAVRQALDMLRPKIEAGKFAVVTDLPPDPVQLVGDPVRLTQVFVNLIGNALKFSDTSRSIEVKVVRRGGEAVIRIRDYGRGIAAGLLPRIFDPFMQAEPGRTLDEGMGLGLAVVKELVALHQGQVEAFSAGINQGSEFVVRLPVLDPP